MRDPNRIDPMLQAIGELWKQNPDYRLGQLLDNAKFTVDPDLDIFYIEDEALMNGVMRMDGNI